MKNLLIISFLALCSCKTQVYSSAKKCIDKEQLSAIVKGVEFFEAKLKDRYHDLTLEMAYFQFLDDLSDKKFSYEFFHDNIADSINEQIFKLKIWDISIRSDENMKREASLFNVEKMNWNNIKLDKTISECLTNQTDSDGIKYFLVGNSESRLSPRRIRDMIYSGTNESDLKNYTNKIAIALGVYYQTAFNIQQ